MEREETTIGEVINRIADGVFYNDYDWASGPAMRALERMEKENESLRAIVSLADEVLMDAIGAFPLPGNPHRADCLIIRSVSGEDYQKRKELAAAARLAGPIE